MSQYVNPRDSCGRSIAKLNKAAKNMSSTTIPADIEAALIMLNQKWTQYEQYHHSVLEVTGADQLEMQLIIGSTIEESYFETLSLLLRHKAEINDERARAIEATVPSRVIEAVTANEGTGLHLPRIQLPSFSGNYIDWLPFKDLFSSLVDQNAKASDAQKLQYLRSSVTGEALHLLEPYTISNANYQPAWEQLVSRYENKRSLTVTYLQTIIDFPQVRSESATELRKLVDTVVANLNQLQSLDYPTDDWDTIITFLVVRKLDPETCRQWELQLTGSDYPEWQALTEFILNRCRSLELLQPQLTQPKQRALRGKEVRRSMHVTNAKVERNCIVCKRKVNHRPYKCPMLMSWQVEARRNFIKSAGLCLNCLNEGHDTSNCGSSWRCMVCNELHNTVLHMDDNSSNSIVQPACRNSLHVAQTSRSPEKQVVLPTAMVLVLDSEGRYQKARALLDQGSQCSFITEALTKRLHLRKQQSTVAIVGIGETKGNKVKGIVELTITPLGNENSKFVVPTFVITTITSVLPTQSIRVPLSRAITGLALADPTYYLPNKIDLLLGADIYGNILKDGVISDGVGELTAQNTMLGWIVSGSTERLIDVHDISRSHSFHSQVIDNVAIDSLLRTFWEFENVDSPDAASIRKMWTDEERQCENIFQSTTRRNAEGRYVVRLPFKEPSPVFGASRSHALSRLLSIEKRFALSPDIREQYSLFMSEYEHLKHMVRIDSTDEYSGTQYFIPHHHVMKLSSTTTKLRVVFDASRPSSTGISLNSCLLTGPRLQDDLMIILLRWRTHKLAFCADIEKMYRQILVEESDCRFQRIVWRRNCHDPVENYELRTVTYGTSAAPYLAVRVLQQLAHDEESRYPTAARIARSDFYVDDVMSGCSSIEEGVAIQKELGDLLNSGGFQLRKWSANHHTLLEAVPPEHRATQLPLDIKFDDSIKALGVCWCPSTDTFRFKINLPIRNNLPTKRTMLSDGARLFDPLGWLTPTTVKFKMHLQDLWQIGVDWDDILPAELSNNWLALRNSLKGLEGIRIPRWINTEPDHWYELHGFCDASMKAYAAVIYSRVLTETGYICELVTAKSRVAPIKTISVPRLELCAAVLLSRLLRRTIDSFPNKPRSVVAWTDSTIVLSWLKSNPCKWKCFVANRTTEILESLSVSQWRHVPTTDNPADCASRGLVPDELMNHPLWWTGPKWLCDEESEWPSGTFEHNDDNLEARIIVKTCNLVKTYEWDILMRYSKLEKLQRVTALVRRFVHNARSQPKIHGHLTANELIMANTSLIVNLQVVVFAEEYAQIRKNKSITSHLKSLTPFLDENDVLRVGGRLELSTLSYDRKHPIILPAEHHYTTLIIDQAHRWTLHGGPQLVLSHTRQKYWIINARRVVKRVINRCMTCFRNRAKGKSQLMGQLPAVRLTPGRPFLSSGVDFAGPFTIKLNHCRGSRTTKGYFAIFICLAVRAIHLEVVSDLTSEAFIAAYKRFVARRGLCQHLYSDNATNFVGANKLLQRRHQPAISSHPDIAHQLTTDGTTWHFIPASSPHFGGLWEAGVKSVKHHLVRVVKDQPLTYEELATVTSQIESCLNSRPLYPLSDSIDDINVITPAHFLIGESLITVPEYTVCDTNITRRWVLVQAMYESFWKRWSQEYLHRLQQRPKWTKTQSNIQVGQLVIIMSDNLPPTKWVLGRVVETYPGRDMLTRVARVKCRHGEVRRAINKLCPLPYEEDNPRG